MTQTKKSRGGALFRIIAILASAFVSYTWGANVQHRARLYAADKFEESFGSVSDFQNMSRKERYQHIESTVAKLYADRAELLDASHLSFNLLVEARSNIKPTDEISVQEVIELERRSKEAMRRAEVAYCRFIAAVDSAYAYCGYQINLDSLPETQ